MRTDNLLSSTGRPATIAPRRTSARAASSSGLSEPARRLRELSVARWGEEKAIEIVGHSPQLVALLERTEKLASFQEPVLIQGESGVGKESLAAAVYLLGTRSSRPFVSVNCPQFQEGNLTVSELFGHRKGAFTGAVANRKGCFETAAGGVVFLDEIGDLHASAQMMLLRALSSGEFQPLGSDRTRKSRVRLVAATNHSLNQLAADGNFRRDLLFRLRFFELELPPLRQRGDDWRLLADHYLERLRQRYGETKRFSRASLELLAECTWPGNVRELIGLTTTAYALADGPVIEPADFQEFLHRGGGGRRAPVELLERQLARGQGGFWQLVREPFLDRELNRTQVRKLVARGLRAAGGRYRRLLDLWGIAPGEYQKFMDFLRHHRLKPSPYEDLDA